MNTKCEITAVFNYKQKDLAKNELAPIHIFVYKGRGTETKRTMRKHVFTGFETTTSQWDDEQGIVLPSNPNHLHINKVIREIIKDIEDYEYSLLVKTISLTPQLLDDFLAQSHGSRVDSFTDFIKAEIDPSLKRATIKEHTYTYNVLLEFQPNILFSDVNLTLIQSFDRFLKKKGLMHNTIYKHHQHVNRFLRLASLKDKFVETKNPYRHFKLRKEQSNRINLSPQEIIGIENLKIDIAYSDLQLVKDLFLFSCYTGLRYSDVDTLRKEHLVNGKDGICIQKKMEKVPKPIILPIELLFKGKPKAILDKYIDNDYGDNRVFPYISNQHLNRLLKSLGVSTEIPMRLTFHVSRHTFGSTLADLSQNPYLIMDLMGHADIKTSMIYIHRSQERINKQIRDVNWDYYTEKAKLSS